MDIFPFPHFVVAVVSLCVFVTTIFSTRLRWEEFELSKEPWEETECNITKITPIERSDSGSMFDLQFIISSDYDVNPTPPKRRNRDTIRAYRTDQPISYKFNSSEQAQQEAARYPINTLFPCYAANFIQAVRFESGNSSPERISTYRTRAIVFTAATVVIGVICAFLVYRFVLALVDSRGRQEWVGTPMRLPSDVFPRDRSTERRSSRHRLLSKRDARAFVSTLLVDQPPEKGGTCAICLEEFEYDARVAKLPCGHFYHAYCATQWFGKGGSFCPYCHYDVTPDVHQMHGNVEQMGETSEDTCSDDADAQAVSRPPEVALHSVHPR